MLYGSDKAAERSGISEEGNSGFQSDSAFEDLSNLKPVPQSPWRLFDSVESCEDKENQSAHQPHPSLRENPQMDQSYSHILSALGSDLSSPTHSPSKAFYPTEGRQRSLYRREQAESGWEEGGNTMQDSLLEAQVFEALQESLPKCQPSPSSNPTLTSPFGHTTDHSDHIEIDLFDSILAEPSDDPCDMTLPSLGATPTKAFCPACQKQVVTLVSYCQQRMPVYALDRWEKLWEIGSWMQCCKKMEKGQDVVHECRRCGRMLARVSTN